MIAKKMQDYVKNSSVIRAMFEEGRRLSTIYGAENVYDFSLGNPNLDPPKEIKEAILDILEEQKPTDVHGYMNNSGYEDVRETIAQSINEKFQTAFHKENILMSVGAGGGLNVIFKTLLDPGDEVVTFAPFFGEYRNYVANFDGILKVIPPDLETFQPNLDLLDQYVTEKTKVILINSPNNPTGVVYSEETLERLSQILMEKQAQFGQDIYLVSDEPYRELAYDGVVVPYPTKYYTNTIIGYSFSKSLSLPGERIGYIVIPSEASDFQNLVSAANIATRILGFVNAPSLFQKVVARCLDAQVNLDYYDQNRSLLYESLTRFGYSCIRPQGAFYLFVKAPVEDDVAFCAKAKDKRILIVPGSSFGCPGYVRIAYCVAYDTIQNSLPGFQELIQECS